MTKVLPGVYSLRVPVLVVVLVVVDVVVSSTAMAAEAQSASNGIRIFFMDVLVWFVAQATSCRVAIEEASDIGAARVLGGRLIEGSGRCRLTTARTAYCSIWL